MKKIISAIIAILLVVGTIMIFATGFNLGVDYSEAKKVTIYLGDDFALEDIRVMTDEILPNQEVKLEKLRPFEDVLSIVTTEISDEQIEKLNEAINQKYGMENVVDDFVVSDLPAASFQEIVSPYIPTILIFVIGLIAYEMIAYRKLGVVKVGLETLLTIILAVFLLFTGIELLGLTINSYITAAILVCEFIGAIAITMFFENRIKKTKIEETEAEKTKKKATRKKKEEGEV